MAGSGREMGCPSSLGKKSLYASPFPSQVQKAVQFLLTVDEPKN